MKPIDSARQFIENAEQHRREPTSITATPLAGELAQRIDDYAACAMPIARAMHHLDEALPTGQRQRAEAAYKAMAIGVNELGNWMRAKGYDV